MRFFPRMSPQRISAAHENTDGWLGGLKNNGGVEAEAGVDLGRDEERQADSAAAWDRQGEILPSNMSRFLGTDISPLDRGPVF
ncbi:hypothetical protein AXF15_02710 [Desulfomicrobium orale DSM 12838]|uniref:Uncharacterized protein n=1 Tax=Desulfomicrobium orale DSM 12838 TaxID=888061 RepID=A0A0X8JNS6_9BACT|nr:hypothetical protein AXF15_02710 [Desulfomicrobium orale DSM 12838]